MHEKIANARKDHLHKISNDIVNNISVSTIIIELLLIKNIIKSAKGTIENLGKMVKQKSGLNRGMHDQGLSELIRQIIYKTEVKGIKVIFVDPKYTSQKCSSCDHTCKENRKKTRKI